MGWPRLSLRRTDVISVASVKKFGRAAFAALLVFVSGMIAEVHATALEKQPLTFVTANGKHTITVEVADTEQARTTGLMFRRSIGADEGMIFVYADDEVITMWMKNTYIPLDMIFVRSNGVIHRIETDTEPLSERVIDSGGKVRAVIEMMAGSAERLGLKPGDKVLYPAFQ